MPKPRFRTVRRRGLALFVACAVLATAHGVRAAGTVDFTRYVAFGDGFTAGAANGTLVDGESASPPQDFGQRHAYPALVAAAAGTSATFPLLWYPGWPTRVLLVRRPGQCAYGADLFDFAPVGDNKGRVDPSALASVVAVPEQRVGDALTKRWTIDPADTGTIDTIEDFVLGLPYAFVGAPSASQIETGVRLAPTFATVWLGNEDVLDAVRNGDVSRVTPLADFTTNLTGVLDAVAATGTKAVVATIPDPTILPLCMDVADIKALVLSNAKPGDKKPTADGILILFGVSRRGYAVRSFQTGAAIQAIGDGLAPAPLPRNLVLTPRDVLVIRRAVRGYNSAVVAAAQSHGFALADVAALFDDLKRHGRDVGGTHLTTRYLGGLFDLEGVYPSNTLHAMIAGVFVQAVNSKYGTSLAAPDVAAVAAVDPLTECARGVGAAK